MVKLHPLKLAGVSGPAGTSGPLAWLPWGPVLFRVGVCTGVGNATAKGPSLCVTPSFIVPTNAPTSLLSILFESFFLKFAFLLFLLYGIKILALQTTGAYCKTIVFVFLESTLTDVRHLAI